MSISLEICKEMVCVRGLGFRKVVGKERSVCWVVGVERSRLGEGLEIGVGG